mmetsp:Transcript_118016/g.328917  ORF Transcript_118016/g.328917 Transcript_118016/m.328917 type:complete len:243 (-) Transcript_118016:160-888(-)
MGDSTEIVEATEAAEIAEATAAAVVAEAEAAAGTVDEQAPEGPAAQPAPAAGPFSTSGRRKPLKLEIGNLTEKNVGQLKKLNASTFPVHYKSQFYQDLLKSLDYSRLGFYADILVSSICCRLEERPAGVGGKALYIMTLSVLKPYQRRSLASQLIQWAVDKAQGKDGQADDVQEIYLHVQTSNSGALSFYKTFGFEVTEEIKNYYKKIEPPDCYVLRKPLNGASLPATGTAPVGTVSPEEES